MSNEVKDIDSIIIQPVNDHRVEVHWHYHTFKRMENDGHVSCYIPAFGIYFNVANENDDEIRRKGNIMTRMFFDHFFDHEKSIKKLILEINRRGFRTANNAFAIKELINKRISKTKFKFQDGESVDGYSGKIAQESIMEVAA